MAHYVKPPPIESVTEEMEGRVDSSQDSSLITKEELKELIEIRDDVALVLGDCHFPFEDKRAMELVFAWLKDNRDNVGRIFLNGDIADFPSLSKFVQDPANKEAGIAAGLEKTKEFFAKLREITDVPIYFIPGNHSLRLDKYMKTRAPELYDVVKLPELLDLEKYDIKYIPAKKDAFIQYGKTLIGHYAKVSKHSAYTAKSLIEDFPGYNIVQNHTHRRGLFWKNGVWGAENSCLADEQQAEYIGGIPNWQKGCMLVKSDSEGGQLPEFLNIIDGKLYFREDIYE